MKRLRKILALMLTLAMCLTSMPGTAFALTTNEDAIEVVEDVQEESKETAAEGEELAGEDKQDEESLNVSTEDKQQISEEEEQNKEEENTETVDEKAEIVDEKAEIIDEEAEIADEGKKEIVNEKSDDFNEKGKKSVTRSAADEDSESETTEKLAGAETTTINVDNESKTVYVVADGFYQDGETYPASSNFYISSKEGLIYFQSLINGKKEVVDGYVSGFTSWTSANIYQNNLFSSKTVHLISDVDLEGMSWTSIGYVHQGSDETVYNKDKMLFYGSFDGHNHKISNLNIVSFSDNKKNEYGLFGRLGASSDQSITNITIENVSANGLYYLGALAGSAGAGNGNVTFSNCHVIGNINLVGTNMAGALYGLGYGIVTNCSVEGSAGSVIKGYSVGALAGRERDGAGRNLNITGNTVSNIAISNYYASGGAFGALIGTMADGASGTLTISGNTVTNCTVNGKYADEDNLIVQADGVDFIITDNEVTPVADPAAKIGEVGYKTLAKAITAANAGDTIEVTADEVEFPSISKSDITIKTTCGTKVTSFGGVPSSSKNVTLDGFEFTCSIGPSGENLTIQNCRFTGEHAIRWAYSHGEWLIKNCSFEQTGQYGIHFDGNQGTVKVEEGSVTGTVAVASTLDLIDFENVTFAGRSSVSGHCNINIYNKASFENCVFSQEYTSGSARGILMLGQNNSALVVMNDCTVRKGEGTLTDIFRRDYVQGIGAIDPVADNDGNYIGGLFVADAAALKEKVPFSFAAVQQGDDANLFEVGEITTTVPASSEASENQATYTVTTSVVDDNNEVIETESQVIVVSNGDSLSRMTDSGNMGGVVEAAIKAAGSDATDVSSILINVESENTTEVGSAAVSFEVDPYAYVFKAGEDTSNLKNASASFVLSNNILSGKFIFNLPVPDSIGGEAINAGDTIKVTHKGHVDNSFDPPVTYQDEVSWLKVKGTADSYYVTVTASYFSTWTEETAGYADDDPTSKAYWATTVGGVVRKYVAFEDALTNADAGAVITLLADRKESIQVNRAVTIDLQQHTLTGDDDVTVYVDGITMHAQSAAGNTIVENGTIKSDGTNEAVYVSGIKAVFIAEDEDLVIEGEIGTEDNPKVSLSAGYYSVEPSSEYLSENCIIIDDRDHSGYYIVTEMYNILYTYLTETGESVDNVTNANPYKYHTLENVVFSDAQHEQYRFLGWYSDAEFNNAITGIARASKGTKNVYGKFQKPDATNSVASVTSDGENFTYKDTLEEALAAAEDGDKVSLYVDWELSAIETISKNIVLDLGGKTVTGSGKNTFKVESNANVTICNGAIASTNKMSTARTILNYGTLTLSDVHVSGAKPDSTIVNNQGTINITSGVYSGKVNLGSSKTVSGGYFAESADIGYILAPEYVVEVVSGEAYAATPHHVIPATASVIHEDGTGTGYLTFEGAFAAADNGDTVHLLADIEVNNDINRTGAHADNRYGIFEIDKDITIDGGYTENGETKCHSIKVVSKTYDNPGHVISIDDYDGQAYRTLNVTLKNLVIDGNGLARSGINAAKANVTIENVTTKNNTALGVCVNASTVAASELYSEGNAWGGVNVDSKDGAASFAMESGRIEETNSVYTESGSEEKPASVTITGGEFNSLAVANGVNDFAVSGGTFAAELTDEFCAEGYMPTAEQDGEGKTVYSVAPAWKVSFIVDGEVSRFVKILKAETRVLTEGESADASKDGYTFVEWRNGSSAFDFTTVIEQDYELTAKFTQDSTVTFLFNGGESTDVLYNGGSVAVTANVKLSDGPDNPGTAVIEFKPKDAEDSAYATGAPSAAGEYTVRVTVEGTEDYTAVSETKDFVITAAVARIGDEYYRTLADALNAAREKAAGGWNTKEATVVEIIDDITFKESDSWTPIVFNQYNPIVINGNSHTITGLPGMLYAKTGSGTSTLTMNDLIFESPKAISTESSSAVIMGYADSVEGLTFNNVSINNATVTGAKWVGAFVGFAAGYSNVNDGPVYQHITFTNCSVTNSSISSNEGEDASVGALMGHASGSTDSKIIVDGVVVKNNIITTNYKKSIKAGALFGTVGALGPQNKEDAGLYVNATVSDNTVKSGETTIETIYGRQGTSTGVLTLTPGGSYDHYPLGESDAAWAGCAEDYELKANDEGIYTVEAMDPVAAIGEETYTTLQKAINAAHEMTGDVTIKLLADIKEYAVIHQKEGLNLTIDGANSGQRWTIQGQIIVDGNARAAGTDTLSICNIAFAGTKADFYTGKDSFILIPSTKEENTPYYTGAYNYAHNITILDCSFTSNSDKLDVVAIKATSGASQFNMTVENVSGTNLHSLAQLTGTTGAVFENCIVRDSDSFINIDGGGGEFTVSDCTFVSKVNDGYGIREKGSSSAVVTLEGNYFNSAAAIQLGKNNADSPSGEIRVISGSYKGAIENKMHADGTAKVVLSGGQFKVKPEVSSFLEIAPKYYLETVTEDTETPYHILPAGASLTVKENEEETTTYYRDLKAALAVGADGTITLLKDDEGTETLTVNNNILLDTDTFNVASRLELADEITLSVKGSGKFTYYPGTFGTGRLAISGAYFPVEVYEEHCAEGYIPDHTLYEEKGYTVKEGAIIVRVKNADTDDGYGSLKDAFDALQGMTGDVTMDLVCDDIPAASDQGAIQIPTGLNLTIDTSLEQGAKANLGNMYLYPIEGNLNLAEKVTITSPATYVWTSSTTSFNGDYTTSSLWAYYGTANISPTARVHMGMGDGVIQMAGGKVNVTGDLAAGEAATKSLADVETKQQLSGGYIQFRYGRPILSLKNTFVSTSWCVAVDNSNTSYKYEVDLDNAVLYLNHELSSSASYNLGVNTPSETNISNGSRLIADKGNVTINANDVVNMDASSSISTKVWTNSGTVNVDVEGLNDVPRTIVTVTGSDPVDPGTINLINNENNYVVMVDGNNIVIANSVARIGEGDTASYYGRLQDAIDAVTDNTATTITLLADITEDVTVPAGKEITLELGDFTITGAVDDKEAAVITNSGTLTINAAAGGIAAKGMAVNTTSDGSLAINGGTYSNSFLSYNNGVRNSGAYIFDCEGNAVINNITVTQTIKGIRAKGNAQVTVTNSTITHTGDGWGVFATNGEDSKLAVDGGTYTADYSCDQQMFDLKKGTILVKDGVFTQTYSGTNSVKPAIVVFNGDGGIFQVEGGSFSSENDLRYLNGGATESGVTVELAGGRFSSTLGADIKNHPSYLAEGCYVFDKADGDYAYVVKKGWTVTFDTKEGSEAAAQTVPDGETATKPEDPTKENYVFDGWYKDENGEIPYDFTDPVDSNLTIYAHWVEKSKVYCSVSLSLKDSIDINIYVKGLPADVSDYTVNYTFNETSISKPMSEGQKIEEGAYRFTVASCAAKDMTKVVSFDVRKNGVSVLSSQVEQSVKKYCTTVLNGDYEEKFKELCQSVLDYGTYAQIYFDQTQQEDASLANYGKVRDGGDIIMGSNWLDGEALAAYLSGDYREIPTADWLNNISASLSLVSQTEMNFYVYTNTGCNEELEVTAQLGGEEWTAYAAEKLELTPDGVGSVWRVSVKGIPAGKLGEVITLALTYNNGEAVTLKYSPLTYAANPGATDNDLGWVCRALYRYFAAAKEYFS